MLLEAYCSVSEKISKNKLVCSVAVHRISELDQKSAKFIITSWAT